MDEYLLLLAMLGLFSLFCTAIILKNNHWLLLFIGISTIIFLFTFTFFVIRYYQMQEEITILQVTNNHFRDSFRALTQEIKNQQEEDDIPPSTPEYNFDSRILTERDDSIFEEEKDSLIGE